MKKVITLEQKQEWISYIQRSNKFDFYHSWTYHSLDNCGTPILYVYEENEDFIAFPLIKREIPNSNLYDCGSVYGYSGPISNKAFKQLSDNFVERFKYSFLSFLQEEKIISIFSRLHPFFDQDLLLEKFGGVFRNGRVVAINLHESLDHQRTNYQNKLHRRIRQLKRKGYYVKESVNSDDVYIFTSIYQENMTRLNASQSYLFNDKYFSALIESEEIDCRIIFVYNSQGVPISGALIVLTQGIIQAHLLATRAAFLSDSPAKILIDEISIMGRALGMNYINLGGGLGFKEDSLFNWKANFSSLYFNYSSWRYIADHSAYNSILTQLNIDRELAIDHFPLYRLKLQMA